MLRRVTGDIGVTIWAWVFPLAVLAAAAATIGQPNTMQTPPSTLLMVSDLLATQGDLPSGVLRPSNGLNGRDVTEVELPNLSVTLRGQGGVMPTQWLLNPWDTSSWSGIGTQDSISSGDHVDDKLPTPSPSSTFPPAPPPYTPPRPPRGPSEDLLPTVLDCRMPFTIRLQEGQRLTAASLSFYMASESRDSVRGQYLSQLTFQPIQLSVPGTILRLEDVTMVLACSKLRSLLQTLCQNPDAWPYSPGVEIAGGVMHITNLTSRAPGPDGTPGAGGQVQWVNVTLTCPGDSDNDLPPGLQRPVPCAVRSVGDGRELYEASKAALVDESAGTVILAITADVALPADGRWKQVPLAPGQQLVLRGNPNKARTTTLDLSGIQEAWALKAPMDSYSAAAAVVRPRALLYDLLLINLPYPSWPDITLSTMSLLASSMHCFGIFRGYSESKVSQILLTQSTVVVPDPELEFLAGALLHNSSRLAGVWPKEQQGAFILNVTKEVVADVGPTTRLLVDYLKLLSEVLLSNCTLLYASSYQQLPGAVPLLPKSQLWLPQLLAARDPGTARNWGPGALVAAPGLQQALTSMTTCVTCDSTPAYDPIRLIWGSRDDQSVPALDASSAFSSSNTFTISMGHDACAPSATCIVDGAVSTVDSNSPLLQTPEWGKRVFSNLQGAIGRFVLARPITLRNLVLYNLAPGGVYPILPPQWDPDSGTVVPPPTPPQLQPLDAAWVNSSLPLWFFQCARSDANSLFQQTPNDIPAFPPAAALSTNVDQPAATVTSTEMQQPQQPQQQQQSSRLLVLENVTLVVPEREWRALVAAVLKIHAPEALAEAQLWLMQPPPLAPQQLTDLNELNGILQPPPHATAGLYGGIARTGGTPAGVMLSPPAYGTHYSDTQQEENADDLHIGPIILNTGGSLDGGSISDTQGPPIQGSGGPVNGAGVTIGGRGSGFPNQDGSHISGGSSWIIPLQDSISLSHGDRTEDPVGGTVESQSDTLATGCTTTGGAAESNSSITSQNGKRLLYTTYNPIVEVDEGTAEGGVEASLEGQGTAGLGAAEGSLLLHSAVSTPPSGDEEDHPVINDNDASILQTAGGSAAVGKHLKQRRSLLKMIAAAPPDMVVILDYSTPALPPGEHAPPPATPPPSRPPHRPSLPAHPPRPPRRPTPAPSHPPSPPPLPFTPPAPPSIPPQPPSPPQPPPSPPYMDTTQAALLRFAAASQVMSYNYSTGQLVLAVAAHYGWSGTNVTITYKLPPDRPLGAKLLSYPPDLVLPYDHLADLAIDVQVDFTSKATLDHALTSTEPSIPDSISRSACPAPPSSSRSSPFSSASPSSPPSTSSSPSGHSWLFPLVASLAAVGGALLCAAAVVMGLAVLRRRRQSAGDASGSHPDGRGKGRAFHETDGIREYRRAESGGMGQVVIICGGHDDGLTGAVAGRSFAARGALLTHASTSCVLQCTSSITASTVPTASTSAAEANRIAMAEAFSRSAALMAADGTSFKSAGRVAGRHGQLHTKLVASGGGGVHGASSSNSGGGRSDGDGGCQHGVQHGAPPQGAQQKGVMAVAWMEHVGNEQFLRELNAYFSGITSAMLGTTDPLSLTAARGGNQADSRHTVHTDAHLATQQVPSSVIRRAGPRNMTDAIKGLQAELQDAELHLDGILAYGAFGVVYRGLWRGLPVAVKTLVVSQELAGREGRERQQVVLEAAISMALAHPNVVATYTYHIKPLVQAPDAATTAFDGIGPSGDTQMSSGDENYGVEVYDNLEGCDAVRLSIVQEYCNAGTLRQALDRGMAGSIQMCGLSGELALRLALDVARGMAHIHSCRIVHGDLKPENVLLVWGPPQALSSAVTGNTPPTAATTGSSDAGGGGSPEAAAWSTLGSTTPGLGAPLIMQQQLQNQLTAKVADFGLSTRLAEGATHASQHYQGTPMYLAPEIAGEGRLGPRADVWSFGLILIELYFGCSLGLISTTWNTTLLGSATASQERESSAGLTQQLLPLQAILASMTDRRIAHLAERCLSLDPWQRPDFGELAAALLQAL